MNSETKTSGHMGSAVAAAILKSRRSIFMYAVIAAGVIAPLARFWLAGLTLIHRDQTAYFGPLRLLAGTALRAGRLPLWNPYCATGMPYFAELIHGVLHPLSIIVAFLFPSDGLDPLIGAYILAAGVGAGVFARTLGASRWACVIAAFCYGLSGYTLSMSCTIVSLAGAASAPWVLAGLRAAGRDGTATAFAFGALSVTAGLLSGEVQELPFMVMVGFALAYDAGGRRGLILAFAAVAVGALIAGVQLAPSWSFLKLTNRALPLPDYDMNQWDLSPWRLIEFFSPGFFWVPGDGTGMAPVFVLLGNPTWFKIPFAESVFVGAATIILAISGIRSSRTTKVLAVSCIVVLWFAMGRHLGARVIQNMLPVARGFRYGEKFLPTFLTCVAILAALGADRLTNNKRAAGRTAIGAAILSLMLLVVWFLLGTEWSQKLFSGFYQGESIRVHLYDGLPHSFVAGLALAGFLLLAARGRRTLALAGIVVVVWCAAISASPYALRPGHHEARIDIAPPLLIASPPGPRVVDVRPPAERAPQPGWNDIDQFNFDIASSLLADTNARHRIDSFSIDNAAFLPIRWYWFSESFGERVPYAARRYGVTHLIFPPPQTDGGRTLAALFTENGIALGTDERNGMELWEVPHREWASFPSVVVSVADADHALQEVLRAVDKRWETAFVETPQTLPVAPGSVLSVSRGVERVEIIAETSADSTLVVNDAFWPGWRAWIDGKETAIFPADVLVRAVSWPSGRHKLVMAYDPPEVRVGKWISVAGVVLLFGVCFFIRRKRIVSQ